MIYPTEKHVFKDKDVFERLELFARKRGYTLDILYRPGFWWRAKLTHWSGCTRRAWYDGLRWRWA